MNNQYDSTIDTLLHIKRVNELLGLVAIELIRRGNIHDASKLVEPEKMGFDYAMRIGDIEYGSPSYYASLIDLEETLKHHYENNSHHPEHYIYGVDGMNLFDIIEMFCDWTAASERTKNGNILKSIEHNKSKLSAQLESIFINTAKKLK